MLRVCPMTELLPNYVNGVWTSLQVADYLDVINPGDGRDASALAAGRRGRGGAAVQAAKAAFLEWRRTPPRDRIQCLFGMKRLLADNFDKIARTISQENGNTLGESRAELQRRVGNLEAACGIPTLMQGSNSLNRAFDHTETPHFARANPAATRSSVKLHGTQN
jgi:malonate-semialdehyde dehydrogenase (acetylating)/methylmalonate-semialdehyde dehydrogenase